jgi:CheY-like chemotaxis protein/GAF domain-containing protein
LLKFFRSRYPRRGGDNVAERTRVLVLGDPGPAAAKWLGSLASEDVARADSWTNALARLQKEPFAAVLVNPTEPSVRKGLGGLLQSQAILDTLADGVALVDFDLRIRWVNRTFEAWCSGPPVGRGFFEALGLPQMEGPETRPFQTALTGKSATTRLHCRDNRYLDLLVTPVSQPNQPDQLLIALGRDVTALVLQQQKLDALHKAGHELAGLASAQLAEMNVAERIELLKQNIRRLTHDLLHYDVIEIRLLDPRTSRLEPLLEEGMAPEATHRILMARAEGNGVTGYVAATGKSYLCPDTKNDPLYLPGSPGARSSLTVPLLFQDRVIGTFNVESPKLNGFGAEDLQFAEIFSHEVAAALNTLELLSAEKRTTATQSVDAISREVALPVDDILAAATSILERYIGHDPEMADKLRQVLAGARSIKACIQKVGEDLASQPLPDGAKPAAPPSLKGLRVLVADNDDRVRRSAHGLLGRWGCIVETARDGKEALTMAKLGNYDAILADIRLPDVAGYEVYRRLREAQPEARVILMTGYGYDPGHSLVKARQDGLSPRHVLYKPFRVDQLLSALSTTDNEPTPPTPAGPFGNGAGLTKQPQ